MDWFKLHEAAEAGSRFDSAEVITELKFNKDGLIPCVAQQADSGEVLMMAWMNREAISRTLADSMLYYWSRSRQKLWKKGEQSGQWQHLVELRVDCDGDTLLAMVNQQGPACHTGRANCFFYTFEEDKLVVKAAPIIDPKALYKSKK